MQLGIIKGICKNISYSKKDEIAPSLIWFMTITGGLILFTLTYVGWRKYKGERKRKVMSILRIDNVINKDTDCKFYSLTMVAEENRMRSTILKTSMEVQRFMMFYLIYFAIILIIPLYAQSKVRSAYSKYSQVYSTSGMTGAEVARKILDENGLYNVAVEETPVIYQTIMIQLPKQFDYQQITITVIQLLVQQLQHTK